MSNFNKVFRAIKALSAKQRRMAELTSFDAIAKEAKVPLSSLEGYFKHLQDIGVIKYSMEERFVHLTSLGSTHDDLPKE